MGRGGGWVVCHTLENFDVCSICVGCGGVGVASGEECCKELLEEGGYLWCGGCMGALEWR